MGCSIVETPVLCLMCEGWERLLFSSTPTLVFIVFHLKQVLEVVEFQAFPLLYQDLLGLWYFQGTSLPISLLRMWASKGLGKELGGGLQGLCAAGLWVSASAAVTCLMKSEVMSRCQKDKLVVDRIALLRFMACHPAILSM